MAVSWAVRGCAAGSECCAVEKTFQNQIHRGPRNMHTLWVIIQQCLLQYCTFHFQNWAISCLKLCIHFWGDTLSIGEKSFMVELGGLTVNRPMGSGQLMWPTTKVPVVDTDGHSAHPGQSVDLFHVTHWPRALFIVESIASHHISYNHRDQPNLTVSYLMPRRKSMDTLITWA